MDEIEIAEQPDLILCTMANHGQTINSLAEEGKIQPVNFCVNGVWRTANSLWAATHWLLLEKHYEMKSHIVWQLEN